MTGVFMKWKYDLVDNDVLNSREEGDCWENRAKTSG